MVEGEETQQSSRFERGSRSLEELHDRQEAIRAVCAAQRERATKMRAQAADVRANSRRLRGAPKLD